MQNFYKKSITLFAALLLSLVVFSQDYSDGVFVLNEGLYGSDTASVSYLDINGTLQNGIFETQNSDNPLGNTAQGMGFDGDFAYIVLNGTQAVKVIDRTTFELAATITDQLENPRAIAFSNGKGYVTNWGDGTIATDDFVAVIDLANNTVLGKIPVIEGPEGIVEKDGLLYVAHQGGFGFGNSVSVIDTADDSVTSITVGDVPSTIKIKDNDLYVLCSGKPSYSGSETTGKLVIIDLSNVQNITEFTFSENQHPSFMSIDDTNIYYTLSGNAFKMALNSTTLPTSAFIETTPQDLKTPYAFSKIENLFYFGDANEYTNDGKVFVYNEDGTFATGYTVGFLPNGFYKNEEDNLSVPQFTASTITMYPNPASGSFRLNTSEKAAITIFDISGRKVKTAIFSNDEISVMGLKSGVYVVQIAIEGKISTQKLIIK